MEMTTLEVAERLGVSQRQVERLIVLGSLVPVRRVGRSWLIDAATVATVADERPRGRPWRPEVAWAALWRLSGLETPWIDVQSSRRLNDRLRRISPDRLAWMCRARTRVTRFRVSVSFLGELRERFRPTGVSALYPGRDMMSPAIDQFDGYGTASESVTAIRECFMAVDVLGNVTLREVDLPAVVGWGGPMPNAVVAVDLLGSPDPREASAGRRILEGLLP